MKKKRGSAKRIFAGLLTISCALWMSTASAATIEEVQQKQAELQQENEELQTKIEAWREDEAKALEYQQALEEQISVLEQKIDVSRESVALLDREIEALEAKLEKYKADYQTTLSVFAQRMRALYMEGTISTLEVLLSTDSLSKFSLVMEMMGAVNKHDQELVDKLTAYMEETKEDREKLEKMRIQEASAKKELEQSQQDLDELYAENSEAISHLESVRSQAQNKIAENEEEDAALNEQLQALIEQKNKEEEERKKQESSGSGGIANVAPISPGMQDGFSPMWPLPGIGIGNITGHFGDMYDNGPHNGLDIGANYGTPIVAAQAGQVLSAEFHESWGNNVLIWHNESFATRYAHCSSLAVSSGEYVEQGQTIGYVGSTGYSFGNHLHFEVYLGGVRVNPDPYLGIG